MPFKKNNPGSPCCNCCPCYPLDGSGANLSGTVALEDKDGGPSVSPVKKLGTGAAAWQAGSGYLEAADHDCFSPSANTSGWAMSFWIKAITNMEGRSCPSGGPHTDFANWASHPGVITKGYMTQANVPSGGGTPSGCPEWSNGVQFGEWLIFLSGGNFTITGSTYVVSRPVTMQAYLNTNTNLYADITMTFAGVANIDTTGGTHAAEWNFVYWYIRNNHSWFHVRGETESSWNQFYQDINLNGGIKNESWPLRVGTVITSTGGELRLGTKGGGSYRIDNLLFDDNPTTYGSTSVPITSPATIPIEATSLYNSGSGKKCPQVGR